MKLIKRYNYDVYVLDFNHKREIWHKVDGPAYIEYESSHREKEMFYSYWLYNIPFFPWWKNKKTIWDDGVTYENNV